jgi:hypothetical protein
LHLDSDFDDLGLVGIRTTSPTNLCIENYCPPKEKKPQDECFDLSVKDTPVKPPNLKTQ